MTVKTIKVLLVLAGFGLSAGSSADAAFSFASGTTAGGTPSTLGTTDGNVTFFANPTGTGNGEFTTPSAATVVAGANGGAFGTSAIVVAPYQDGYGDNWISGIAGTNAQWDTTAAIGTQASNSGQTAIYAIAFTASNTSAATLSLTFAVDNYVSAIYVNGSTTADTLVSGATLGVFNSLTTVTYTIAASSLVNGTNYLYIDAVNSLGGGANPGGIIFAGTVTNLASVPEPSSIAMVSIAGLMGLVGYRARRNRSAV